MRNAGLVELFIRRAHTRNRGRGCVGSADHSSEAISGGLLLYCGLRPERQLHLLRLPVHVAVELLYMVFGQGDFRMGNKYHFHQFGISCHLLFVTGS